MDNNLFNPIKIIEEIKKEYDDFFKSNFLVHNAQIRQKYDQQINKEGFLWKGGYFSLTPTYKKSDKNLLEFLKTLLQPEEINSVDLQKFCDIMGEEFRLYYHQEDALRNIIKNNRNTIVSTGTGSGKSLCYFLPILLHCITQRNNNGVKAIISYPMNALANDQLDVLKNICFKLSEVGINITYGIYIGATPKHENEMESYSNTRRNSSQKRKIDNLKTSCLFSLRDVESRFLDNRPLCKECIQNAQQEYFKIDLVNNNWKFRCSRSHVAEKVALNSYLVTRKEMQQNPPDILITNFTMMELLLLREADQNFFSNRNIKYLVLDEAHTHVGASGSHVACQMRRVISRIKRNQNPIPICIATSATLTKLEDNNLSIEERTKKESLAISKFASQLFGQDFKPKDVVRGQKVEPIQKDPSLILDKDSFELLFVNKEIHQYSDEEFKQLIISLSDSKTFTKYSDEDRRVQLYQSLIRNSLFWEIYEKLGQITNYNSLIASLKRIISTKESQDKIIWQYLFLSGNAMNPKNNIPLVNLKTHIFFRPPRKLYVCPECYNLYDVPKLACADCKIPLRIMGVCHGCGKVYFGINVNYQELVDLLKLKNTKRSNLQKAVLSANRKELNELSDIVPEEVDDSDSDDDNEAFDEIQPVVWFIPSEHDSNAYYCSRCGTLSHNNICDCGNENTKVHIYFNRKNINKNSVRPCAYCDNKNATSSIVTETSQSFEVTIRRIIEILYHYIPNPKKLLFFIDNVQMAKGLPPTVEHVYLRSVLTQMTNNILDVNSSIEYPTLYTRIYDLLNKDKFLDQRKLGSFQSYTFNNILDTGFKEVLKLTRKRINAPSVGLFEIDYLGLNFESITNHIATTQIDISKEQFYTFTRIFLDELRTKGLVKKKDNVSADSLKNSDRFNDKSICIVSRNNAEDTWKAQGYNIMYEENKEIIARYRANLEFIKGYEDSKGNYHESFYEKLFDGVIKHLKLNIKPIELLNEIISFVIQENILSPSERTTELKLPSTMIYELNLSKIIIKKPDKLYICNRCYAIKPYNTFNICVGSTNSQIHEGYPKIEEVLKEDLDNINYYRELFSKQPSPLIARDDTASSDDRQNTEIQFKRGNVNLVVASPTLELGVDIGDLNVVGLLRTPPSPSNYIQRIGRAGRDSKVSLAVTIIKDEIIDNHYFNNPLKIINGNINEVELFLHNEILVRHHAYSLILENLSANNFIPQKMSELAESSNHVNNMGRYINDNRESLIKQIEFTFINDSINGDFILDDGKAAEFVDSFIENLKGDAISMFSKEFDDLGNHYKILRERRDHLEDNQKTEKNYRQKWDLVTSELRNVGVAISEMKENTVIDYLKSVDFLPNYAFPSNTITLIQIPAERKRKETYISNKKSNMYPRAKNVALGLFAPYMKIIHNGNIYKSMGITNPEELHQSHFYLCPKCKRYFEDSSSENTTVCECGYEFRFEDKYIGISPNRMSVEWVGKVEDRIPTDTFAVSDSFLKDESNEDESDNSRIGFKLYKPHFSNVINLVKSTIVKGNHNEYHVCEKCGKLLTTQELEQGQHRNINKDSFGEYSREGGICYGKPITRDNYWSDKLCIYNKFPTRVIRIVTTGNNRPREEQYLSNYLITMMNAIISASYIITHANEGEINGFVTIDEKNRSYSIVLYDNVEGGIGYVDIIQRNFDIILRNIKAMFDDTTNEYCDCDIGCPSCIMSSRRRYDAKFIDKRLIQEFFSNLIVNDIKEKKDGPNDYIKRPEIIASNAGELTGYDRIKHGISTASDSIDIVSMYVTDDQLLWSKNEKSLSWIDLLVLKKITDKIKIRVVLRSPIYRKSKLSIQKRQEEIRRLQSIGIEVRIFEKTLPTGEIGIAHNKEVIIDPLLSSGIAFVLTGNLSFESYKNNDCIVINTDFSIRKQAYQDFNKLWEDSREIIPELDLMDKNYELMLINDETSREKVRTKISSLLDNAKNEVIISDPYLHNPKFWEFISQWLQSGVKIKILTANIRKNLINRYLDILAEKKISCEIKRYFDSEAQNNNKPTTILHKRYIIIDDTITIDWDMGFNILFGNKFDNSVTIFNNRLVSKMKKDHFLEYYIQDSSSNVLIRHFPSEYYRNRI